MNWKEVLNKKCEKLGISMEMDHRSNSRVYVSYKNVKIFRIIKQFGRNRFVLFDVFENNDLSDRDYSLKQILNHIESHANSHKNKIDENPILSIIEDSEQQDLRFSRDGEELMIRFGDLPISDVHTDTTATASAQVTLPDGISVDFTLDYQDGVDDEDNATNGYF